MSGKRASYMDWLVKYGRREFRVKNGRPYDDTDARDKDIMTVYWRAFKASIDPEEARIREEMERQVRAHNSNIQLVLKEKARKLKLKRQKMHQNPTVTNGQQNEDPGPSQPTNWSVNLPPTRIDEVITDEDLEQFCSKKKDQAKLGLSTNFQFRSGNGICNPEHNFHVISVFPIVYLYKYNINRLLCYPAEIAITTFNMKEGIIYSDSKFVEFDERWAFGQDERDHRTMSERVNENEDLDELMHQLSSTIGIDHLSTDHNPESPFGVFEWLRSRIDIYPYAKILVDMNQFRFVYNGLKNIAKYHGFTGQTYFNENIKFNMVSIQDFTDVLLDYCSLLVARRWSDQDINNQYLRPNLVPNRDKNTICEYHETVPCPTRYNCMKAHNSRLVHHFFTIMKAHRLQNFRYSPPVHEPCIEDMSGSNLPEMISEPSITLDHLHQLRGSSGTNGFGNEAFSRVVLSYADFEEEDEEEDDDDDEDEEDDVDPGLQNSNIFLSSSHYDNDESQRNHDTFMRNHSTERSDRTRGYHDHHMVDEQSRSNAQNYGNGPIHYEDNRQADREIRFGNEFRMPQNGNASSYAHQNAAHQNIAMPTNLANRNGNLEREEPQQQFSQRYSEAPVYHFADPSPGEFEVPTLGRPLDGEQCSKYMKIASKNSHKAFAKILLL
ncbi:hypothetical protein L5515_000501 [Caenorhabditis briggsae]|uniref:Maelstrom domain-containing protein n=1 Tax=Caenorhabditis briggsae TaxID=6238 RepID=A0AAE9DZN1_CAEBR|nr:hypothetical protein L5515_000501 [Caenorhabditis briggsae]